MFPELPLRGRLGVSRDLGGDRANLFPMAPPQPSFQNPVFVAQGGFDRMREVARVLARYGIDSEVVAPPKGTNTNG